MGHTLPALPVIPARFDGVLLEAYLRQPEVVYDPLDHLLTSPVLRDPDFARAVHTWIEYWTVYATDWFPSFLTRMAASGNAVDSALAMRGLPPSLRYLPLIESGYDPGVTSRSGAVGLWQLMPTTARGLGLTVAPLVDERHHAEKSTDAALTYLAELHADFGSWFLALAAYNTGPTRVRSVLRRYAPEAPRGDSLFWALRHRFPVETREFVPKLYGAMWVASRPEAYGYEDPTLADDLSPARLH
ncbi:MAG: lytic transglycosylase domain-containing protein [Gemmatimonadota bacterium]|nr:lytic transglycosylase domain-containing protein [Gemmatimonadota bacterium]MDH3422751.1 lytic transglycosylase domain-containing protein [Gemmatimonadota bacterium]